MKTTEEMTVSRAEHLAWCKERAAAYLDEGDTRNAWASFASDMGKHPETASHPGLGFAMMMLLSGQLDTVSAMRRFIEGFN